MTRQRKHLVLLMCGVALVLMGCTGSPSAHAPDPPTLTLESLGNTGGAKVSATDRPDPPAGFTDNEMDVLAALMTALATTSFSREVLDTKHIKGKLDRVLSPLKTSYPETVTELFQAAEEKYGRHPWRQIFVDPFAPGSKPRGPAKILKVAWDVEGGHNSGSPFALLRLQVHAAYEVGTKAAHRIIGVRRTIELISFGPDYAPSLGGETVSYGTDRCEEAIDGDYLSTTDKTFIDQDRQDLKESLASTDIGEFTSGTVADLEKTISTCQSTPSPHDWTAQNGSFFGTFGRV